MRLISERQFGGHLHLHRRSSEWAFVAADQAVSSVPLQRTDVPSLPVCPTVKQSLQQQCMSPTAPTYLWMKINFKCQALIERRCQDNRMVCISWKLWCSLWIRRPYFKLLVSSLITWSVQTDNTFRWQDGSQTAVLVLVWLYCYSLGS